ncbi:MAG: hypothetical protein CVT88_08080, partial [Candidatus Altiarchaeales archaeon HGW-Altiarchaeales-1]
MNSGKIVLLTGLFLLAGLVYVTLTTSVFIEKTASTLTSEPGNWTDWTIKIQNNESGNISKINITDLLPNGWKFNKTLNEAENFASIKYERVWKNCSGTCTVVVGFVTCTAISDLTYNRTWNDANTETSYPASPGDRQLVKWNLTHLGNTSGCFVTNCNAGLVCTFAATSIPDNKLLPGENLTLMFRAYTTSNASEWTNINNASAEGVNESGNAISVTKTSANVTVYYPYAQIKKTWEQTTEPGNFTKISINLTNIGNATIKAINITDHLPKCFSYNYAGNTTATFIGNIENKTWGYKGPVSATDSDGTDVTAKINASDDNRATKTLSAMESYAVNGTFNTSIYAVNAINNASVVCEVNG